MSRLVVLAIGLSILLSGCQQNTPEAVKADVSAVQEVVQKLIPKCKFEQVEVPSGKILHDEVGARDTDRILAVSELWDYQGFPSVTSKDFKGVLGWSFTTSPGSEKVWVCNSAGRSITQVNEYEDVVGPEECSNMVRPIKENPTLLAKCIRQLEENLKLGYWVVIRQSDNAVELQRELIQIAKDNLAFGQQDDLRPILLGDGFAITMDGPFEYVSISKIENIEWIWNKLTNSSGLDRMLKHVSGYPKSYIFEGDTLGALTFPNGGSRDGLLESCFDDVPSSFWENEGVCKTLANQMNK